AAVRRISRASPTTAPKKVHRSSAPRRSAAIRPTHGACTTCMVTNSNGAAIGITTACPAALTPICTRRRTPPLTAATAARLASDVAVAGPTKAGPAAPLSASASNPNAGTTTSVSASSPSSHKNLRVIHVHNLAFFHLQRPDRPHSKDGIIMEKTRASHREALEQIFTKARTHSAWSPKPVPDELLVQIYELMKWGPTSANSSPARIVFVKSKEAKEKLLSCLAPGNIEKTRTAP